LQSCGRGKSADLFPIVVPANKSEKLLDEALNYNTAKSILILSGGFGETKVTLYSGKRNCCLLSQSSAFLHSRRSDVTPDIFGGPKSRWLLRGSATRSSTR
jgi:hypothetical protein